jgi:hypothetical protein
MFPDHMSRHAQERILDEDAVPLAVSHDEKTIETPAIPEPVGTEEPTVPVTSSLEKILRHEMLRHRSARDED